MPRFAKCATFLADSFPNPRAINRHLGYIHFYIHLGVRFGETRWNRLERQSSIKILLLLGFISELGIEWNALNHCSGGEGGIRTPDRLAPMPHFECGAFNHSATSPKVPNQAEAGRCNRRGWHLRQGARDKFPQKGRVARQGWDRHTQNIWRSRAVLFAMSAGGSKSAGRLRRRPKANDRAERAATQCRL